MKLPAYPRYKPSGIEWLGDVPEHWKVNRVKWSVVGCINGVWGDEPTGADDVTCVRVADFDRDNFLVVNEPPTLRAIEPSQLKTRQLRKGDLLIEKSGGGEKQLVGCVVSFDHDFKAVCSNFVARMPVVSELPPRFWCYVHAALYAGKLNYPAIKQTTGIQNLDSNAYLDTPAPFPHVAEQWAIATFLDRETGRVDRLVAKKRELIERLKEKRTALISRTVTRGLPPAAARAAGFLEHTLLKPSGIDWIGDIPKHWKVRKFSRCAFFQEGPGLRNWQFTQDGIRVICVTNITEAGISFSNYEKFISEDEYQGTYRHFTVAKGDLLLSSSGNSWGKVATFNADDVAILNTSTIRVNENSNRTVIRPLIGWLLISEGTLEQLGLFMTGSCQPNFGPSHLARMWICVPPLPEQAAIAAYLDQETAKLDELVGKVEEAVERLQEYRTALITAAVTGKIDVRKESHA